MYTAPQKEKLKMYKMIDVWNFREEFEKMGRSEHFSYEGLGELFEFYKEWEDPQNHYKLDVIAICCAWTEYESKHELLCNYDMTLDEIKQNTTVIEFDAWNEKWGVQPHYLVMNF